jgi:hypothetical protein
MFGARGAIIIAMRPRFHWIPWAALIMVVGSCDRFPLYLTTAFVANRTRDPLEMRVFRPAKPLDCGPLTPATADALNSSFEPGFCQVLRPGRAAPLDREWQSLADRNPRLAPPRPVPPGCETAALRVAGLPDTLLVWRRREPIEAYPWVGDDDLDPHGIYLERAGRRLLIAGTLLITAMPFAAPLPEVSCAAFPALSPGAGEADVDGPDAGRAR